MVHDTDRSPGLGQTQNMAMAYGLTCSTRGKQDVEQAASKVLQSSPVEMSATPQMRLLIADAQK